MARKMGWDYGDGGLNDANVCFKRKNRWMFKIRGVSALPETAGSPCLPPLKGGRPSINFKEMEAQHLNETVYFPGKPEWKPINLSLYDLKKNKNVVMEWIKNIYNPDLGIWRPSCTDSSVKSSFKFKIPECELELYDGCGNTIERWILENVWPQSVEFGELDMSSSEVVTIDLQLRYDRAYTNI
jgi:hypothetical protein